MAWALASGCSSEAGRFEINLQWPEGYPAPLVGTEARVIVRIESEGRVLAETAGLQVSERLNVGLDDVPNGDGLVAIVEVRASAADGASLLLYGLSRPFDLQAGASVRVDVRIGLQTPPVAGRARVVPTGVPAVPVPVNRADVDLILETDTGVTALISNRADFAPGEATQVVELRAVEGDTAAPCSTPADREGFCRFQVSWDLDRGEGPCVDPVSCRRRVFVRFGDALGVLGDAVTADVVVDLVPPVVVAQGLTVTPTAAKQADEIIAQVPFSEPVQPNSVVLRVGGAETGEQLFPENPELVASSFTYSLGRGDQYGDIADLGLEIGATDLAGNRSVAAGTLARVRVDGLEPSVRIDRIEPAIVSLGSDDLSFDLSVSEGLEDGGIDVQFGPIASACGRTCFDCARTAADAEGSRWTCEATESGRSALENLAEGVQDIFTLRVEARDAADNRGTATATVSVDLLPPSLAGEVGLLLRAPNDLRGAAPTALAAGGFLQVSVTLTENTRRAAMSLVGQGRQVVLRQVSQAGASFVYELDVPSLPDGAYALHFEVEDLAGNPAVLTVTASGELTVDNTGPAAPAVGPAGRIVFRRAPWGESALGTPGAPRFTIRGGAGAVEAGGIVRVYQASGAFVTRINADDQGSFPETVINISDAVNVGLSVVDGAGNESPTAATLDGQWHAALTRLNGDSFSTPHRVSTSLEHQATLFQPPNDRGTAVIDDEVDRLGQGDGRVLTVASSAVWFEVPTSTEKPVVRDGRANVAFDRERGRLVLFGGNPTSLGTVASNRTFEWDGAQWREAFPISRIPPPTLNPGLVWDGERGVVLMHGSGPSNNETWTWDGVAWREVTPRGARPEGNQLAYDAGRGLVVLHNDSSTWEWNGSTWTDRAPSGTVPEPGAMYFDPARGRVRLISTNVFEWTGSAWVLVPTSGVGPGARFERQYAVYDESRGRALIVGEDTRHFELVGNRWLDFTFTNATSPFPPLAGAAYDPIRERPVVIGARAGMYVYEQSGYTELNGVIWSELNDVAYDHARQELVGTDGSRTYVWNGIAWRDAGVAPPAGDLMWDPGRNALLAMASTVRRWTGSAWFFVQSTSVPAGTVQSGGPPGPGARLPILVTSAEATYEWQTDRWVLRGIAGPCEARNGLINDPVRQVIFTVRNDATCEWGTAWTTVDAPPVIPFPLHNLTWDALHGRRHAFSGGTGDISPFNATEAESVFTAGAWQEVSPRLTGGPPPRVGAQFGVDYGNNATYMFAGQNDFTFGQEDAWRLGRNPLPRAAVLASFDLRSIGTVVGIDDLERIRIEVRAGATGHALLRPGTGAALDGYEILVWNARRSRWDLLRRVDAGRRSAPATDVATIGRANIPLYVSGQIPELRVAVRPRGVDYGDRRSILDVDYINAEVDYRP